MKRALVTGSSGFVGRHLAAALVLQGYGVDGVDIRHGTHTTSVCDARRWLRRDGQPVGHYDLVVHCAAVVGGRTMIDGEPLRLAVEDLTLDAELFRWAMRARPKRIVAFSSSAAYPVWAQTESAALVRGGLSEELIGLGGWEQPDQTYGWVKLTLERLAAEANAEGIRTHVFRPFSGYGSDQDDSYPFPAIIRRAIEHRLASAPFLVWGSPRSTRDWVHIDDVVACVLAHIDADEIGPVNICTGRPTTFAELAHLALRLVGFGGTEIAGDSTKPIGVFHRVGDPTVMRRIYTPQVSIEQGVARAVEVMRSCVE